MPIDDNEDNYREDQRRMAAIDLAIRALGPEASGDIDQLIISADMIDQFLKRRDSDSVVSAE